MDLDSKKRLLRRLRRSVEIFDLIVVLSFIAIAILAIYNRAVFENLLAEGIQQYGYYALFAVNFLLEFVPQVIAPALALASSIAGGLNVHLAILVGVFASFLGSVSGYEIGLENGFELLEDIVKKRNVNKVVNFMNNYGKYAVLAAALSPLPYVPMIIGALNMNRKNFALFGLIPRAIGLIVVGYAFYFGIF